MYFNSTLGVYTGDKYSPDDVAASPAQLTAWQAAVDTTIVQQLADQAIVSNAKANANLILLIGATPAQINTFCTNKFPTLTAPERGVLADMLLALQIVAKNVLR
jgi:hypothetical protein